MKEKNKQDLIFRKNFYEKILKEKSDYYEVLVNLSSIYSGLKFYKKTLEIDRRLAKISPSDPVVFYNLASDYSVLGDVEKSAMWLKKAIKLGYKDFKYMEKDPDLENLRKTELYRKILKMAGVK